MPNPRTSYLICPDCKKRGVTMRFKPNGEDNWACRYCQWFVFIHSNLHSDKNNRDRLVTVNPDYNSW
jgi:hypothetical protein